MPLPVPYTPAAAAAVGRQLAALQAIVPDTGVENTAHYFVLGDSRDNSLDSRYWGTVPRELIIGRCLMIVDSEAPGGVDRVFIPLK